MLGRYNCSNFYTILDSHCILLSPYPYILRCLVIINLPSLFSSPVHLLATHQQRWSTLANVLLLTYHLPALSVSIVYVHQYIIVKMRRIVITLLSILLDTKICVNMFCSVAKTLTISCASLL